jgi:glyoxylase-like metal-dependent hydrolase (beta-lactamase superfamily II)
MRHISDNVYRVPTLGGFVNMYVIDTGDGLAVVDTGVGKGAINAIEKGLKSHNFAWGNVKHIFITHFHPDHTGGLQEIQRRTDAQTHIHTLDAPYVRGEHSPGPHADLAEIGLLSKIMVKTVLQATPPTGRIDSTFEDSDTVLSGWQVVHLPGHSPGQCGFYNPTADLLIGGDVMMHYLGRLRMPIRAPSPDWEAVKDSIRKVQAMQLRVLCLGHGSPLVKQTAATVDALAARMA